MQGGWIDPRGGAYGYGLGAGSDPSGFPPVYASSSVTDKHPVLRTIPWDHLFDTISSIFAMKYGVSAAPKMANDHLATLPGSPYAPSGQSLVIPALILVGGGIALYALNQHKRGRS